MYYYRDEGNSIDMATRPGVERLEFDSFRAKAISLRHSGQTGFGAHAALYQMGIGGFSWCKSTGQ
jgi:hypothetical protein